MYREVVLGLLLPWTFQYYLSEPLATSLADCVEIDKLLNGNGKGEENSLALGIFLNHSPFNMPTMAGMVIWQSASRSFVFSGNGAERGGGD